jgi:hypothetical protein
MTDSATHVELNSATPTLSKREKFQAKKNYRKARNALTRETPPKAQPKVFTPVEKKCETCNTSFLPKNEWTSNCTSCKNLSKFKENIFNPDVAKVHFVPETMEKALLPVYDEYGVRVTYDITSSRHDGYCSDYDESDVIVTKSTKTVILPLFKAFKKPDITFDNTITNTELLAKYYKPCSSFHCNCGDGETAYRIQSAQVFKKADMIQLDD